MMEEIHGKADFQQKTSSTKVVVVDFSATWCGPCQMLTPILKDLSQEFKEKGSPVAFFGCDVDENREVAMEFKITAVPSVAMFKNGDRQNDLIVGVRGKDTYRNEIENLLKD